MNIHPHVALIQKFQARSKYLVTLTVPNEVIMMLIDAHTILPLLNVILVNDPNGHLVISKNVMDCIRSLLSY